MPVSGILRCVVVLLLFALHIDSKAVSLLRQKRAPDIQHPRLGRRSQEKFNIYYKRFQHPRLGRKRAIEDKDLSKIFNMADIDRLNLDPNLKEEYIKLFLGMLSEALQNGEEIDQNVLQYPRQGRGSNFFAYPRQGRAMPAVLPKRGNPGIVDSDDLCCPIGIKARWIVGEEPNFEQLLCKCCDGLTTRILRQQMVAFAACAPIEMSENRDSDVSL